jgi:hypothetical protein
MNLRNKFLKSLPIFSFLIIINSQFVHAKITEWDDFTEPLKVKFEMMYGANKSIEVFIPESIIKNNEKLKLYLEITGYNFEYAEPYVDSLVILPANYHDKLPGEHVCSPWRVK